MSDTFLPFSLLLVSVKIRSIIIDFIEKFNLGYKMIILLHIIFITILYSNIKINKGWQITVVVHNMSKLSTWIM